MKAEKKQERTQDLCEFFRFSEEQVLKRISIFEGLDKAEKDMGEDLILEYAKKIRPVMAGTQEEDGIFLNEGGSQIFWIKSTNASPQSCFFSAEAICEAEGLKEIGRVKTYYKYNSYPLFLDISTNEAIFQCPKDILDKVCAFQWVSDSNKSYSIFLNRYVLTTIYYSGVLPQEIANQPVE